MIMWPNRICLVNKLTNLLELKAVQCWWINISSSISKILSMYCILNNWDWGTLIQSSYRYLIDPYKEITIRSGSSILNEGGVVHNITKVIWHEKYVSTDDDYDIAVFKVDPIFEYNSVTRPVDLPEIGVPFYQDWGIITGWGYFIVR